MKDGQEKALNTMMILIKKCFRKYDNPSESFKDHALFLTGRRYSKLFDFSKGDYKAWAKDKRQVCHRS
jgi:flagellum-specific peptidoglycan hydrolase FlgJ